MTKEEALEKLRYLFHKTRLTHDVSVDPEIIYAILYYEEDKMGRKRWYQDYGKNKI